MRKAGILMPVSSLPSPYGIGTLGAAAREFADLLALGGQTCWQMLPVGPTSYGDSPYQSFSSYAGNPYFIDLDDLADEGLLLPEEYQDIPWGDDPARVDYGQLYRSRYPVLRLAVERLLAGDREEYRRFCQEQAGWLPDYALFMALKGRHGGNPWDSWPDGVRLRQPDALEQEELMEVIYQGVKAGAPPESYRGTFTSVLESMGARGAGCFILGCTELPLAVQQLGLSDLPAVDPTEELAKAAIRFCGYQVKGE